jgi:copper oxidase (laccase) domain-containing protein
MRSSDRARSRSGRRARAGHPRAAPSVVETRPGAKPHVNLSAIVRLQLLAAGILPANIDHVAGCTMCEAERFFSFRRDGRASGRHLTAIVAG